MKDSEWYIGYMRMKQKADQYRKQRDWWKRKIKEELASRYPSGNRVQKELEKLTRQMKKEISQ